MLVMARPRGTTRNLGNSDLRSPSLMAETPTPSPNQVLDLLNGFRSSKVLFTCVKLGIPDLLAAAQPQPVPLEHLVKQLSSSPACRHAGVSEPSHDGLGRLCDAAVSLGLLGGSRQGYHLTDVAQAYLLSDTEGSLAGYVQHSDMLYKLWDELESAVLTGSNCWQQAFGLSSADVFGSLYRDDAAVLRFMRGMDGFSQLSATAVLTAFDLSRYRRLVDLGGATGALAAAACRMHPDLHAVVVDLPHVVEQAREHFGQRPSVLAVAPRLSWVRGDFFGPAEQLPDGDLFVLGRILHDWHEPQCRQLLKTVHEKLPAGGALLVAEMLLDEGGTSPPEVLLQSLNMLAQTHGRERSLSEYRELLEAAGFIDVQGKKTGTYLDAVIAFKAAPGSTGPQ